MLAKGTLLYLVLFLMAALAVESRAGDATVTLDSTDGSSAFRVLSSSSIEVIRVGSHGRVGIGLAGPAYALDVVGDINLTGDLRLNGTVLTPVTSVSASSPLASSGGATPTLSIQTASGSQAGALSSADWNTFNGKESALTFSSPLNRSSNTIALDTVPVANGGTGATTLSGVLHGNGTTAVSAGTVALGSEVSGTLPLANGGTGVMTAAAAANAILPAQADHAGKFLTTDGSAVSWGTVSGGGGGSAPTGVVSQFAGSSAPAGYLLCDGSAVSRTTYAALYVVIGTTYGGGDGATTFNLPNLKGRVPAGFDAAQADFDACGKTGGEKTHTLTTAEMPSHTHTGNANEASSSRPARYVFATAPGGGGYGWTLLTGDSQTGSPGNYHDHTITINNTGSDTAHNNLQPYIVLNYIIKY